MGGQGKSQVALEYCRRKENNPYSVICWVDATTESTVIGSFQTIYEYLVDAPRTLSEARAKVDSVLQRFRSWPTRWLIVFDNYDDTEGFPNIKDFIPRGELGAILVTSRHADASALVLKHPTNFIELPGLERAAARELLIELSQTRDSGSEEAETIVERLGYHPLAITQAAAYIRKKRIPLCNFLDRYRRRREEILKNTTPQLTQYRKKLGPAEEETSLNVFTTWELSFEQLQSQTTEAGGETWFLTLFAFFDHKDISEEILANLFSISSAGENSELPEPGWDSEVFINVLLRLKDLALLQAFAKESDGFHHVSLHPLIKDWIQLRTHGKADYRKNTLLAAALVGRSLKSCWYNDQFNLSLSAKQSFLQHIRAQEENYETCFQSQSMASLEKKNFIEYLGMQDFFARFLSDMGIYGNARVIIERVKAEREIVLGPEHPDTVHSMHSLAVAYLDQRRWQKAEELLVQVLALTRKTLGEEHENTLISLNNLASTYMAQGRWQEAERLQVQVLALKRKTLGEEHADTLSSMHHLANTYYSTGRRDEAVELMTTVVDQRTKTIGPDHPSTLNSMHQLALIYEGMGHHREAVELKNVVDQYTRVLGSDHPRTLISMHDLASVYEGMGHYDEAVELIKNVIDQHTRILGSDHPDTLSSMYSRARIYDSMGRRDEAVELMKKVVVQRTKVIGPDHPDALNSMHNLARIYDSMGRRDEAVELMKEVVDQRTKVIGPDHPDTVVSVQWLHYWLHN